MKGGLVIALGALECLEESGVRLPWTLMLNSDEETGSYHSQRTIYEEAARVTKLGGVGVALEPAGAKGELIVERAGSGQFFIEVRGRSAHVGRDFRYGISAVNELAALIVKIADLSRPDDDMIVNIGPIEGGTATNVVPDRARAWGNVRFPTAAAAKGLAEELRAIAGSAVRPGVSVEVSTSFIREAKPVTDGTRRLAGIAQEVSRTLPKVRELPLGKTAGVCDGNIMQGAGLPTLDTLGVRGGGLHTPEEWIELDSLVERCQLLAVFLMRACEQSGR
jgi:glutamate carboxypeptidase